MRNYFFERLSKGEDADTIANELIDALNSAMAEHKAKLEQDRTEQRKDEIVKELSNLLDEYAILCGCSLTDKDTDLEEVDVQFIRKSLDNMINTIKTLGM